MNAERLLGYLMKSGLRAGARSEGFSFGSKAKLGMGALGIAMAAYEHFAEQTNTNLETAVTAPPPPPLPNTRDRKSGTAVPPPLPPSSSTADAVATTSDTETPKLTPDESLLLIRAMIAAANADNFIDKEEEQRIIDSARKSGFSDDDIQCLEDEIHRPWSMFELATGATTPELAKQVYIASVLAVDVDSEAETTYLRQLAGCLHLTNTDTAEIHAQLGIEVSE